MPHFAFESKSHAIFRPSPRPAQPAPALDRAPASPFASLLDDSAQSIDQAPANPISRPAAEPAPKTKVGKAGNARGDAKSADAGKSANAGNKPDKKADKSDQADKSAKATSEDQTASDAKPAEAGPGELSAVGLGSNPPADGLPSAIGTAPDAMPTGPDAVALAPLPGGLAPADPAVENTATVAAATIKFKPDPLATLATAGPKPTGASKPAGDSQAAAEAAPPLHSGDKPPIVDADKDLIAQARGEAAAKHDRPAAEIPSAPAADAQAAAPKSAGDAMPPTILPAPAHASASAAQAQPAAVAPAVQAAAIPLAGVAIEIAGKALAGKNHFEIRLDPPELGRIDVRLDIDRDGNVTSRMVADRTDTLDLLRRDAAGLERALNDAGLKTADNGLQFSLRDQSSGQEQSYAGAAQLVVEDATPSSIEPMQRDYSRLAASGGGLDIRV